MGVLPNALAAIAAVFALAVARKWDPKETLFFNLAALTKPFLIPLDGVAGRSREEQIEILRRSRRGWEEMVARTTSESALNRALFRYFYGPAFADAVFGPRAARVARLSVPSSSSSSSDPDGGRSVPVTCACPHDAGPESDPPLPLVLFFHSGGLISGSVESELHLARYLASRAGAAVCSVGYRLAWEGGYPAAVEDALDAATALLRPAAGGGDGDGDGDDDDAGGGRNPAAEALGVGLDASTFATWGTSAGGYVSAGVARLLAHRTNRTAALQVSLVPMAKPHGGTPSPAEYWHDPFWSGSLNAYAWSVYLEGDDGTLSADWRASLLMDPPEGTVARLPPAYVQINTRDGLRDEGKMYAERLRGQGKLVGLDEYDVTHIGGTPPFDRGTPGDGAYDHAISVLISHLSSARSKKQSHENN